MSHLSAGDAGDTHATTGKEGNEVVEADYDDLNVCRG